MPNMLNAAQTAEFNEKGFTYARGLFAPDEVKLLTDAMEQDPAVRDSILDRRDGEGRSTRIALWNRAGDSVYGLAARCRRMVDTSAALLGGPVYHYQSKLTAKEPEVGGAWEWHQDYGYWYYNGCIRPDLLSVMIALDKTDARTTAACRSPPARTSSAASTTRRCRRPRTRSIPSACRTSSSKCPIEYCELEAGDALIFHCNAIHRSDANRSANRRWTLLICYNRVDNDTIIKIDDRYFVPLETVDDDAIRRAGLRFARGNQEHFAAALRAGPAQGVVGGSRTSGRLLERRRTVDAIGAIRRSVRKSHSRMPSHQLSRSLAQPGDAAESSPLPQCARDGRRSLDILLGRPRHHMIHDCCSS